MNLKIPLILLLCLFSCYNQAGIMVVVHPNNSSLIDEQVIRNIYLKKLTTFPSGGKAIPLGRKTGSEIAEKFTRKLLQKNPSQLRAYWAKLIFTGKGKPPEEISSDQEVVDMINENPEFIGIVSSDSNIADLKVAMTL